MTMRTRIIAGYRGDEYDAAVYLGQDEQIISLHSERPVDGFAETDSGYVCEVPLSDCEGLYYLRPVARYRQLPVAVLDERDVEVYVESLANDAPAAASVGLQRIERGVYRGWVPASDVQQRRLETIDLNPTSAGDPSASGSG